MSYVLMLGVGCRLFRWICVGIGVVAVIVVTGRAGKSRCSVVYFWSWSILLFVFYDFRTFSGRSLMSTSTSSTFKWQMPIRTFSGVVSLGTKSAFSCQMAVRGFVSDSLASQTLYNSFLVTECFNGNFEVENSSNVLQFVCSMF